MARRGGRRGTRVAWRGMNRLRATIERKIGVLPKGPVPRALRSVGEVWMTEAKRRTPVDTGALRASGFVEGPKTMGKTITVRLAFGGPGAPYAVVVHENLRAFHRVGQAKYLESVIAERGKRLSREVVAMMAGARVFGAIFGGR